MSVLNVRIVCTTSHNVPFIDASLWDLSGILSNLTAWQVHLRERTGKWGCLHNTYQAWVGCVILS